MRKLVVLLPLFIVLSCSSSTTGPVCDTIEKLLNDPACKITPTPTPTPACVVPTIHCDAFVPTVYKCHAEPIGPANWSVNAVSVNDDGIIEAVSGDTVSACRSCGCAVSIKLR